jgi:hypothetical protein
MIPIIDKVVNPEVRDRAVERCREKGIALPTFAEMKDPTTIPARSRTN